MGEYHHDFEADEDFLNKTKINTANWTSLKNCVLKLTAATRDIIEGETMH